MVARLEGGEYLRRRSELTHGENSGTLSSVNRGYSTIPGFLGRLPIAAPPLSYLMPARLLVVVPGLLSRLNVLGVVRELFLFLALFL